MTATNKEYALLHANAEWMKDILLRMEELLSKSHLDDSDLDSLRWLVKQGLKAEREE
jgi:hypothetical protein